MTVQEECFWDLLALRLFKKKSRMWSTSQHFSSNDFFSTVSLLIFLPQWMLLKTFTSCAWNSFITFVIDFIWSDIRSQELRLSDPSASQTSIKTILYTWMDPTYLGRLAGPNQFVSNGCLQSKPFSGILLSFPQSSRTVHYVKFSFITYMLIRKISLLTFRLLEREAFSEPAFVRVIILSSGPVLSYSQLCLVTLIIVVCNRLYNSFK